MTWDVWETDDLGATSDFEAGWKVATEVQKLWFLIKYDEIKKFSKRADLVKSTLKQNPFTSQTDSKEDIFWYTFFGFVLICAFICSIFFIYNTRYLIIAISICYIVFKFLGMTLWLDEYDFQKNKNAMLYQYHVEFREIEIYLIEKTPLDGIKINAYMIYGEPTLEKYIINSFKFRCNLLEYCNNDFEHSKEF